MKVIYKSIYKITNTLDGKIYIGQTKNVDRRRRDHFAVNVKNPSVLQRAMNLHGRENFTFEVIDHCFDKKETDLTEVRYIKEFDCLAPKGYNVVPGGQFCQTEEGLAMHGKMIQGNKRGRNRGPFPGFVGVTSHRSKINPFKATVNIEGKTQTRVFPTFKDAAEAYDKMVLKIYGEDASLNYPEKRDDYLNSDLNLFWDLFLEDCRGKTSKYNNVSLDSFTKRWQTSFGRDRQVRGMKIGTFDTEIEAAQMADKIVFFFGLNKPYNFPEEAYYFNKEEIDNLFSSKFRTSSFKGVCFSENHKKWKSQFRFNGRNYHIGVYDTEIEARDAYEKFRISFNEEEEFKKREDRKNSIYRGLKQRKNGRWFGSFKRLEKTYYTPAFDTPEDAQKARQKKIEDIDSKLIAQSPPTSQTNL